MPAWHGSWTTAADIIPLPDVIIGVTVLTFDEHCQKIPCLTVASDLE